MKLMQLLGIVMLFITSIGALVAGYSLITDPSGNGLKLPLQYLDHSPFTNYLIPGLILFSVIGLFGVIVLLSVILRMKNFEILQLVYGILLTGWIVIQVFLLQFTYYLHYIFGGIGLFMIALGLLLWRMKPRMAIKSF